jgi:hypothetical protein
MDISPTTKSGWLDNLMIPVRGIIQPIVDAYRKRTVPYTTMEIPAWAVSEQRNTPIPYITEHRYDFGNGGVYGPPDMPVSRGIVNVPRQVTIQPTMAKPKNNMPSKPEFYNGPQEMVEIFVYSPLVLPTNLPCSTSMLKY